MTPHLKAEVLAAPLTAVIDALAAAVKCRATHEVRNLIGQYWKPVASEQPKANKVAGPGFKEWLDLAYQLHLVRASQIFQGEQYVLTNEDEWEPWGFIAGAFPLARLQRMCHKTSNC